MIVQFRWKSAKKPKSFLAKNITALFRCGKILQRNIIHQNRTFWMNILTFPNIYTLSDRMKKIVKIIFSPDKWSVCCLTRELRIDILPSWPPRPKSTLITPLSTRGAWLISAVIPGYLKYGNLLRCVRIIPCHTMRVAHNIILQYVMIAYTGAMESGHSTWASLSQPSFHIEFSNVAMNL